MSDAQQSRATLSLNFVARQICLGNCHLSMANNRQTNMASVTQMMTLSVLNDDSFDILPLKDYLPINVTFMIYLRRI